MNYYGCFHLIHFNIAVDYLLMLTIFHVQNVLIILNQCLLDFLVPKHMHQWHMCSYLGVFWDFFMHVLFLIFLFWSIMFSVNNILTLGTFGCSLFVINLCELLWSFSSDSFQYCFGLFTDVDYLASENVLIILNWGLCDFLVLKHINELHTLYLHWLFTDADIFLCGKCSRISILLLIIYWCWLFSMCKIFLSFLINVYVIFLYWNISLNCMHFIFIGHLLMLDIFSCGKCSIHSGYVLFLAWSVCFDQ